MGNKSGISLLTLAISALAALAAAVVVPLIWAKGTLIATAMTPVIVALVSEALNKPAQAIKTVAPRVTRRSATGAAVRSPERFDPLAPDEPDAAPAVRDDDPFGLRAAPRPRHHWKLALATGAVAFAVAVVALTGSELVFGGPATRDSGRTTFFGHRDKAAKATPTPAPSPGAEETPTPTATETPSETVTPAPTPTTAPTTTPVPTATP